MLHLALKQCCEMECISLSLINDSDPKAMLIYSCCQPCLRTISLNGSCCGTKLQCQPVLLGYTSYADNQFQHCIYALKDASEATVMWPIWSNVNPYRLRNLLLSHLCLALVFPLGWHHPLNAKAIKKMDAFHLALPQPRAEPPPQPDSAPEEMLGRRGRRTTSPHGNANDVGLMWLCNRNLNTRTF